MIFVRPTAKAENRFDAAWGRDYTDWFNKEGEFGRA
jgi:hypothetical protein